MPLLEMFFCVFGNLSGENPMPILWAKRSVILTCINQARESLEAPAHNASPCLFRAFQGYASYIFSTV